MSRVLFDLPVPSSTSQKQSDKSDASDSDSSCSVDEKTHGVPSKESRTTRRQGDRGSAHFVGQT